MNLRTTIIRPAASLGFAALLLGACTTSVSLNSDNLQNEIAAWLQTNYQVTADVSCPDDRPIKQGDVFTCMASTDDGQGFTLQVTQNDDAGNVSWVVMP